MMKLKEKLSRWWNSENCFLKNRWFQIFSPLIAIGVGVATFLTGGLFLLSLLAVIIILAYMAEKGELDTEKQSQRVNKWFGAKKIITHENEENSSNRQEYQSVLTQEAEESIIGQNTNNAGVLEEPVVTTEHTKKISKRDHSKRDQTTSALNVNDHVIRYEKACLILEWIAETVGNNDILEALPSDQKKLAEYRQIATDEARKERSQKYPELEKAGVFQVLHDDSDTRNYKSITRQLLRIVHPDKIEASSIPEQGITLPSNNNAVLKEQIFKIYNMACHFLLNMMEDLKDLADTQSTFRGRFSTNESVNLAYWTPERVTAEYYASCERTEQIDKETAEIEKRIEELDKSIAEIKKSNAELDKSNAELDKSNAELDKSRAESVKSAAESVINKEKNDKKCAEIMINTKKNELILLQIVKQKIQDRRFSIKEGKYYIGEIKILISNPPNESLQLSKIDINWLLDNNIISNKDLPKEMQKITIMSYLGSCFWSKKNVTSVSSSLSQPEARTLSASSQ